MPDGLILVFRHDTIYIQAAVVYSHKLKSCSETRTIRHWHNRSFLYV